MTAELCVLPVTLRQANVQAATTIKQALSAVYHLDDAGCEVLGMTLRHDQAVIEIAPPPPGYITAPLRKRISIGGVTCSWYTTRIHGVQVEWTKTEAAPARATA